MQQLARGIASLGRGEDTQLVHMTPGEVRGLQQLALAHGGSLTINPQTGLAEAGFLRSLLPTLIGAGLMMIPGMQPLGAAAITGVGFGVAEGNLKKGLMAGLGAYGGAGLAGNLGGMGAETLANEATKANALAVGEGASKVATGIGQQAYDTALSSVTSGEVTPAMLDTMGMTPQQYAAQQMEVASANTPMPDLTNPNPLPKYADMDTGQRIDAMKRGFSSVNPLSSDFNKTAAMSFLDKNKYQLAGAAAGPVLEAMKPQAPMAPAKPEPDQYDRELARYHLSPDYKAYVPPQPNPYYRAVYAAEGGDVSRMAAGGTSRAKPLSREADIPSVGIAKDTDMDTATKDAYTAAILRLKKQASGANLTPYTPEKTAIKGLGDIGPPTSMMAAGGVTGMADGGYTYNEANGAYTEEAPQDNMPFGFNPKGLLGTLFKQNPQLLNQLKGPSKMAQGGVASLSSEYAAGGKLLQGPGDGMSDSIPAVIKGARPQRAALAQGEFVIPADVVSHLGNGSTDAGAKRLYAMMDKIRHARTGNKKQGRQINPSKFMPA